MRRYSAAAVVSWGLLMLALAGCAGGQSLLSDAPPQAAATADVAMAGRWMLSAPNAPMCGMNFTAKPGAGEGAVAPEGGCPERFFLSRRWTLDKGSLIISGDQNDTLATLSYVTDHFEGKSNTDTPVTLAR